MTELNAFGHSLAAVTQGPPKTNAIAGLSDVSELQPLNREALGKHGRSALILVVERDPHVRALESFFLNEAGFKVEFAGDGVAALERARELKPDIIISEVLVPKLDGLSLCRAVRSDAKLRDVVVLIFSILAVESRAREAGADAFLRKPLAESRLVDTVRELLGARRTVRPDPEGLAT